ncbi:MAG: heparin lyase I family protein [Proteobacteria bacterium]|nr:heparin lyase I family protein [Pseudomonadota bacterium]
MLPIRCAILRAVLVRVSAGLAVLAACTLPALAQMALSDGFDVPEIRTDLWELKDIRRDQYGFVAPGRCGNDGAIAVRIDETTGGSNCGAGELCQRAEFRENPKRWIRFGDEAWYGFSIRVRGEYPDDGLSTRWILAQFKEQTDESPFLALRFDDGVFHITVQDDEQRFTVASAQHTIDQLKTYRAELGGLSPVELDVARQVVEAGRRLQLTLAQIGRQLRARSELFRQPVGAPTAERFLEYGYVTDRPVADTGALRIVPGTTPVLPDPKRGWVDVTLHVRAGRDGAGLVQVWANGKDVVTVEGNIGHRVRAGDRQYFKFGQYRAHARQSTELLFDQFKRGTRREQVYPACR